MILYIILALVFGFVIGWILSRAVLNKKLDKRYNISWEKKGVTFKRLQETIRRLAYEFIVKRKEHDFILNVLVDNNLKLQVLHRSHFVEFSDFAQDIDFGMVIYLPYTQINQTQKNAIFKIINSEEPLSSIPNQNQDYVAISTGRRVRTTSYLISRIIKEAFRVEDEYRVSYELLDEGILPYHEVLPSPKKWRKND